MAWIIKDFECLNCNNIFEGMIESGTKVTDCPECGSVAETILTASKLATFSMADAEGKKKILLERSNVHTKHQVNKEPEKYGLYGDKGKLKKDVFKK